jgi:hypothetical protein
LETGPGNGRRRPKSAHGAKKEEAQLAGCASSQ